MTLDGIMEAPGHDEHPDGKNAWALQHAADDMQRYKIDELFAVDALLLGRVTYQIWAAFWPSAPRDEGFADRINALPKYVVSKTLKDVEWVNSTLLGGDIVDDVRWLKEQPGGDILTSGSADLVDTLMEHDLIDEYRIAVYPVVLGSGKHLFRQRAEIVHMRLRETRTFSSGIVLLSYEPARETPTTRYVDSFAWTKEQIRSLDAAQNVDRVLATVLFTDIVDSTGQVWTAARIRSPSWPIASMRPERTSERARRQVRSRSWTRTSAGSACTSPRECWARRPTTRSS